MTQPDSDPIYQLAQELSASQSSPLTAPDGKTQLTLREAVSFILEKTTRSLTLHNRPVQPTLPDDLYGHILSLRAEQLQTQALIAALCQHLGLDVAEIVTAMTQAYNTPTNQSK